MNYRGSIDNDSRKKWKYRCYVICTARRKPLYIGNVLNHLEWSLSWISDEATLSMAAEHRFDSSSHNRKHRHRRSACWIHDNVRKKIARGYQESHEWCVRRRNVRNSRRTLQYLQRLRNNARGISSKMLIVIAKALIRKSGPLWRFPARGARRNLLRQFFYNTHKIFNLMQLSFDKLGNK